MSDSHSTDAAPSKRNKRATVSIPLTVDLVRQLFDYDPATGLFTNREARGGTAVVGKIAGTVTNEGYWRVFYKDRGYLVHRLVWMHFYGAEPSDQIDHIDCDRANNRISNLRVVDSRTNSENKRSGTRGSLTGKLGVTITRTSRVRPYIAQLRTRGVLHYLGRFATAEEAHAAYVSAKRAMHPGGTL